MVFVTGWGPVGPHPGCLSLLLLSRHSLLMALDAYRRGTKNANKIDDRCLPSPQKKFCPPGSWAGDAVGAGRRPPGVLCGALQGPPEPGLDGLFALGGWRWCDGGRSAPPRSQWPGRR